MGRKKLLQEDASETLQISSGMSKLPSLTFLDVCLINITAGQKQESPGQKICSCFFSCKVECFALVYYLLCIQSLIFAILILIGGHQQRKQTICILCSFAALANQPPYCFSSFILQFPPRPVLLCRQESEPGDIHASDRLQNQAHLLFLELKYAFPLFKTAPKSCSGNHVS
nr:hypothetical protein Iba_chr14cCG16660 [Ipomoea batatas]